MYQFSSNILSEVCLFIRAYIFLSIQFLLDGQIKANIARVIEVFEDPLSLNLNNNTGKRLIYEVFKYAYAFHGKEIEV